MFCDSEIVFIFVAASLLVPCLALAQDEDSASSEDATYALIDAVIDADTREVQNQLGEGADASVKTDEGTSCRGLCRHEG